MPLTTKIILSHHNYKETPHLTKLQELRDKMFEGGADIVKIATTANDVSDAMRALLLNAGSPGSLPTARLVDRVRARVQPSM